MYSIEYIQKLRNNINVELEPIIKQYMQHIIDDISKDTNITDTFELYKNKNDRRFKKKEPINNKNIDISRNSKYIERIKEINNRSDHELNMINIKKILNKLSFLNFSKLKNEFICHYTELYNHNKNIADFDIYIFESLVYTNTIFVDLYIELFTLLNNINKSFTTILNSTYLQDLLYIYKKIKLEDTNTDIFEINKHNDKIKSLFVFYLKAYMHNLIETKHIYNTINNIQTELFDNLKIENNKIYCEEITNFILLYVTTLYKYIYNHCQYENIYKNINIISKYKPGDLPSITNKIIFKHKDLQEKYKF